MSYFFLGFNFYCSERMVKIKPDCNIEQILSSCSASMSELKKNPITLFNKAKGAPIAILNHNIPAETYKWVIDKLDDIELTQMVNERMHEKRNAIEVNIYEL